MFKVSRWYQWLPNDKDKHEIDLLINLSPQVGGRMLLPPELSYIVHFQESFVAFALFILADSSKIRYKHGSSDVWHSSVLVATFIPRL